MFQLAWSSGPAFFATVLSTSVLAPMAFNVWWYAPFVELENGPFDPNVSILMNWITKGLFERIYLAWKHHRVGLATLGIATLLSSSLPIAASGILESRHTIVCISMTPCRIPSRSEFKPFQVTTEVKLEVTAQLGIAPSSDGGLNGQGNRIFGTSDQYLQAAAYAAGQPTNYRLPFNFSYNSPKGSWSGSPLSFLTQNLSQLGGEFDGSIANVTAEMYAVRTRANCQEARVTFGGNDTATATRMPDRCSYDFGVETSNAFQTWHFADSTPCSRLSRSDSAFRTFVYAIYRPFTSESDNVRPERFLVMFCQPSVEFFRVNATMSFTMQSQLGSFVGPPKEVESFPAGRETTDSVVGPLFNLSIGENALNGFDIPEPQEAQNYSRTARANIAKAILKEGIYAAMLGQMVNDSQSDPATDWCMQPSCILSICED
jgi:hypothetical protein